MWLPLAFQVGLNYFQMIILLKDRDFLSSLEVIDILMVISCIWPFKGATVNIGYCISYCKIFETGLFAHMNACLRRVPPTGPSCPSLNIGPSMLKCIGLSVSD